MMLVSFIDIGNSVHIVVQEGMYKDQYREPQRQVEVLCRPGYWFRSLDGPMQFAHEMKCAVCWRIVEDLIQDQASKNLVPYVARDTEVASIQDPAADATNPEEAGRMTQAAMDDHSRRFDKAPWYVRLWQRITR